MQAAFLISAKSYTEKQVGLLFFVFGMSQFLCMAPSGYFLDYSNNKINWVIWAGCATATLTVITALSAAPFGDNMGLMIILKMLQGGITSILPPGFNGITLGIVGSTGFTHQVSRNRMMNHIGTALVVAIGSLIAYWRFPHIGHLFVVSPLAAIGMFYNLRRIKPNQVDKDAARALIVVSPTMTEYEQMDDEKDAILLASGSKHTDADCNGVSDVTSCRDSPTKYTPPDISNKGEAMTFSSSPMGSAKSVGGQHPENSDDIQKNPSIESYPKSTGSFSSFKFGWSKPEKSDDRHRRAQSPLTAVMDPSLITFSLVVFSFHTANSSVLPLVMQSISLEDPQAGILLSGLCILIAQTFMSFFAKLCGDYSPIWGRKSLMLTGLFSLTLRCFLLTFLSSVQDKIEEEERSSVIKALILSTQLLDSVGAGIFGTLHILVTSDISGGTGRFSLMLGITTAAMCLGGTVSGYVGQALAQDYGYPAAFSALGIMSLVPLFTYAVFMPETLPDYARPKPKQRRKRLLALLQRFNASRKDFAARMTRRNTPSVVDQRIPSQGPGAGQIQLV
jgi:MFS family permease